VFPLQRIGLHAFSLTIRHPADGQWCLIQAPYPQDFAATLLALRGSRSVDVNES
jgi:hypothetical protein